MDTPKHIRAVLEALQFSGSSISSLQHLTKPEWSALLEWCDARQLTLLLHSLFADQLPGGLRDQMADRRNKHTIRFKRLKQELFTVTEALRRAGLELCVLKGLSHSPLLTPDPITRAQGDIDLWLQPSAIPAAKKILFDLGYRPIGSSRSRHIDPMTLPTNWRWRGDRLDPEMPIAIELHYELWSEHAEGIRVPGEQGFWERKTSRESEGYRLTVLCDADLIGFAALHLLLHVLHGELPMQRAWEIANFLHTHSVDGTFGTAWREAHPIELRRIEIIVFRMVTSWFGCKWPVALDSEAEGLPRAVALWLEEFSLSPLKREWEPNKDELWLHLALIPDSYAKVRVLFKRLLPFHGQTFNFSRLAYHASTLLPAVIQGLRWLRSPGVLTADDTRESRSENEYI